MWSPDLCGRDVAGSAGHVLTPLRRTAGPEIDNQLQPARDPFSRLTSSAGQDGPMSPFSTLDHLECPRCRATHDAAVLQGLCPACASPLLARYDLSAVRATPADVGTRPPDLWRYHELLPVS